MTDAGYVIAGWVLTGAVLAAYLGRLALRARRFERADRDGHGGGAR